ncbi:MAG: hypothetical protein KY445_14615 [Armatimonadetes bacterium]|nr:hypothetical protein [Armatimonadota bacterium]
MKAEPRPLLTLEEVKEMIANGEASSFDWRYPDDIPSLSLLGGLPNPDFDEESAKSDPRTRMKVGGRETTPEVARAAWKLLIDPKYRHFAEN